MALIAKDGGGASFDPVPEGTHIARCITVVDLGVQESKWGLKDKVYFGFEVPSERVEWEKDGVKHQGCAIIGSTYTKSINDKSILGQHLTSWRGKAFTDEERQAFDLFNVLGAPCLLSVVHKVDGNKTYANINGIMRLPQGTVAPEPETPQIKYSASDPATASALRELPQWLQDKCKAGGTVLMETPPKVDQPEEEYFDDDIPF